MGIGFCMGNKCVYAAVLMRLPADTRHQSAEKHRVQWQDQEGTATMRRCWQPVPAGSD